MADQEQHISGPMAILCIVNGMIGGLILILPVMALEGGWLMTMLVILMTGFISYYSCHLCLIHTGTEPDLDVSIQKHFWGNKKIRKFYEICILSTLLLIDILYYELIVLQWIGLAPPHEYTPINPLINYVALFILVLVIKFKEFGATLMAYGIVSIAAYLLFVTWVVGSQEPKNDGNELQLFGGNGIDLAAALGQAFAIQCFFIPVLKKNKKSHKHKLYLLLSFVLGSIAYAYIGFMGSYGILHREFREADAKTSRTIEGYFQMGTWQVNAIEIIYLVHLYSVFPQYLLIGKKRFFSIVGWQESQGGKINKKELIYITVIISMCLGFALFRISLRQLIEFNGAVLGFFFIYFFPVAIHFKCVYWKKKRLLDDANNDQEQEQKDEKYVEMIEEKKHELEEPQHKEQIEPSPKTTGNEDGEQQKSKRSGKSIQTNQSDKAEYQVEQQKSEPTHCQRGQMDTSKPRRICELLILGFMLVLGLIIMIQGMVEMSSGNVQQ